MSGVKHLSRRPYLVLALVGMVVFGSLLTAEFTWWDDGTTIHHNPRLNPPSWDTLGLLLGRTPSMPFSFR
ncbi:MAG: hypothetical protein KatS3mg104_2400 [Phycisphaerae bacterium]|nr:MAG: hypothetical protein KatS3mg104_2400 [Phycisphaerae bacterium]